MKALNKKGVELSMMTIVIAVIAMIVLVVVITIFTGQTRKTSSGYTEITDSVLGSKCNLGLFGKNKCGSKPSDSDDYSWDEKTPMPPEGWSDCSKGEKCWVPKSKDEKK